METAQNAWKAYSGRVAWPTVALTFFCISAFAAVVAGYVYGHLPLWLAIVGNTFVGYLVFTPLHEASHSNIGTRKGRFRWLDSVVGWASGAILIAPFAAFKVLHLRHHSNTNNPEADPDHWMATSNPALLLLKGLTIIPRYYFHFFAHADKQAREKMPATFVGIGVLATLYAVGAHFTSPLVPLLLWVVPALLALCLLALVFDWLPHYPHRSRDRYTNTRAIPGAALNVILLGQNYHLIHHLYPAVPFYNYKPVFQESREFLEAKGAPIGWRTENAMWETAANAG